MSIRIIKAGILDSIQDAGRFGFQHLGINPGGAMDPFAMQVANILVGNARDEAVLELHFPASVFLFREPALIALSGADFSATVNAEPVPSLHPLIIGRNDVLQFHGLRQWARAYLSVAGGLYTDQWLNSHSTHLKIKAGGFRGRVLIKDDELFFKRSFNHPVKKDGLMVLPWEADVHWGDSSKEILVLYGHEWDRLTPEARDNFTQTTFVITQQSDRMGYRLNNLPLTEGTREELISSAVSFGTIQLLPDGKLIILTADHPTTGGYPRVAHVISAHHSRLAQLKAGDRIRFGFTSQSMAEDLFIKQQQHLQQLQNACTFRLEKYFNETLH